MQVPYHSIPLIHPIFHQTFYRYDTRVDYVYQHQSVRQIWAVDYVNHIETDASDHNAVEVAFKRVLQKPNTNNFA